ncbi:MAG: hypothetical protein AAF696_03225 [Bacteroidota bacterium]
MEGEQEDWQRALAQIPLLKTEYPQFAELIEKQFQKADQAMAATSEISDPEMQAEAMQAANEMISGSFIGKLASVQHRIERIGEKQDKLGAMRMKTSVVKKAEAAMERSNKAVRFAHNTLANGASNLAEAEAVVGEMNSELITAESRLSSAIRSAKKSMHKEKIAKN